VNSVIRFLYLIFPVIILQNCDPTSPLKVEKHPVLKWEVDTIAYPGSFQTSMMTIWGNSISDLWVAGHNNRGYGKIFHFDGTGWKDVLPIPPGIIDSYSFYTSLNLNDETFLCGDAIDLINDSTLSHSSLILSYKSDQWNISKLGEGGPILSIAGDKHGKLYASGVDLTLFIYENNLWKLKNVEVGIPLNYETKNINSILVDQNQNTYLLIYCYNTIPYVSYNYFVKETETGWVKVDSFNTDISSRWGLNFWESPEGDIYSYNPGIYRYNNKNWNSVFNNDEIINAMQGTSSKNIWAAGYGVYHFNGSEWYEYELSNQFGIKYGLARNILLIENNVFILFSNSFQSYVLKGHM
jgi:hypothetical protein